MRDEANNVCVGTKKGEAYFSYSVVWLEEVADKMRLYQTQQNEKATTLLHESRLKCIRFRVVVSVRNCFKNMWTKRDNVLG